MAIVRVRRWGKTLAFTIPHGYAKEFQIKQGEVFEVTVTRTGLSYRKIEKNTLFDSQPYRKFGKVSMKAREGEP